MKYSEIIKMNPDELSALLKSMKNQLSDLRLMHYVSVSENPMLIRNKRRVIAKIKTALNHLNNNKLVSDAN